MSRSDLPFALLLILYLLPAISASFRPIPTPEHRMQIQFRVDDQITIIEEADTQAEAYKTLSGLHEVFGPLSGGCGVCQSPVYPRTRVVQDNAFMEAVCSNNKCRAVLAFGQNKKGGSIFPKRKDADGNWIPNGGFAKWTPEASKY